MHARTLRLPKKIRPFSTTEMVDDTLPMATLELSVTLHVCFLRRLDKDARCPGFLLLRHNGTSIVRNYRDAIYIPRQGHSGRAAFAYRDGDSWCIATGCFCGTRKLFIRQVRRHLRRCGPAERAMRNKQLAMVEVIDRALLGAR